MDATKDLIIIGGGGAGLAAAQYGARANLRTLLIEGMATGGQCLIIDKIENYPGFPEALPGMDFINRFEDQARRFGAEILIRPVTELKKEDNVFTVHTDEETWSAYAVILATGAKHRHLGVPGEDEFAGRGVSYCATCDGPFFQNKKILVVGGGDAACDEGMFLSNLSDRIIMVHRRDRFRAQKALAERVLNNPSIEVRFNTIVKEIRGGQMVTGVLLNGTETGSDYEEEVDAVFIFIGSIPQTQLAGNVELDEDGYIKTDQRMMTSRPGLFAVGDVRSSPFRQLVVAAGEGAVAAHSASQYIDELKGEAYL